MFAKEKMHQLFWTSPFWLRSLWNQVAFPWSDWEELSPEIEHGGKTARPGARAGVRVGARVGAPPLGDCFVAVKMYYFMGWSAQ
jgi:hypothetical protein